jgi:hypothetical protein
MIDRKDIITARAVHTISLVLVLALSLGHTQAFAKSISSCKTGYTEWIGKPVADLAAASHTIALVNVAGFVADPQANGKDGYYVLSPQIILKGKPDNVYKIYGFSPFDQIPQSYFNIEWNHNRPDREKIYRGEAEILEKNGECHPVPKFIIGYNYLILLGTNSKMSFEPINSVENDNWYRDVKSYVNK